MKTLKEVGCTPLDLAKLLGFDGWKVRSINGEKTVKMITILVEEA